MPALAQWRRYGNGPLVGSLVVDKVVIESSPNTEISWEGQKELLDGLRTMFPDAVWIRPTDWKQSRKRDTSLSVLGPHIEDVLAMGRWYIRKVMSE